MKSNKKLFILIIILVVVLVIWGAAFFVWLNSFAYRLLRGETTSTNQPIATEPATTAVFGVQMQNECFTKYNDFLKNYGADYSKCLNEFNFKQEYCGGFDPDKQALSNENILVILDASGSMEETIPYETVRKIDVAKKVVSDFLIKMPAGVNTGLIVYGHKGSNSEDDRATSCQGVEEIIKLGANNAGNVVSAINLFEPKGWTPIAASLDFAKEVFKKTNNADKNYLILISDGVESCGGDATIAAESLSLEIPNLTFSVVSLTGLGDPSLSLAQIAEYGKGRYISVEKSADISKVFNNQLLLIKRECLSATLTKIYSGYRATVLGNLSCWLDAYKKESDDFNATIVKKSVDNPTCNQPIADALRTRHTDFWLKKQDLAKSQEAAYKKIEADYTSQMEVLDSQQQLIY